MWPADAWKAAPVKKGSLVLIHGQVSHDHDDDGDQCLIMMIEQYLCNQDVQVAHKSERNLSSSSRHAYTFHIIGQNRMVAMMMVVMMMVMIVMVMIVKVMIRL